MPNIIFFKYEKAKNHVTLIFSVIFWEKSTPLLLKQQKLRFCNKKS